jgi:Phospholipase_D-nuclease N-terminal
VRAGVDVAAVLATSTAGYVILIIVLIPLAIAWGYALIDIVRRIDIGIGPKALWAVCVILLPFLGTLIYLLLRPASANMRAA